MRASRQLLITAVLACAVASTALLVAPARGANAEGSANQTCASFWYARAVYFSGIKATNVSCALVVHSLVTAGGLTVTDPQQKWTCTYRDLAEPPPALTTHETCITGAEVFIYDHTTGCSYPSCPVGSSTSSTTPTATPCVPGSDPAGRVSLGANGLSFDITTFAHSGETTTPGVGKVGVAGFSFSKPSDQTSTKIQGYTTTGKQFATVTIQIYKPCSTTLVATYKLDGVVLTDFTAHAAGATPTESVKLTAKKIDVIYPSKK